MRAAVGFLARRLLAGVGVLWGAATLAFVTLHVVPGDPVDTLIGPTFGISPRLRAQLIATYGFDSSLPEQYATWLGRLLTGHLGVSYQLQRPVVEVLDSQLWPTAQLALTASGLATLLAVALAVSTAGRGGAVHRWGRRLATTGELLAVSSPTFWIGIVLITVFSARLGWFPSAGAGGVTGLVLPAFALALPIAGVLAQVLREGLDAALEAPFVASVRARGVGSAGVLARHALRHAALPLVTLLGWAVGSLLGGAVVTEAVFARPGVGRVTLAAISSKDIPVVTAVVLLSASVFVVVNTVIDLLYLAIDPRLREPARGPSGAGPAVAAVTAR